MIEIDLLIIDWLICSECDYYYLEERTLLPLYRAARGKQILLTIRYNNPGRQIEDLGTGFSGFNHLH